MKSILFCVLALASSNSYASSAHGRFMNCTYTKNVFGAPAEISTSFRFVAMAGELPTAQGSFHIVSENIDVSVSSNLISLPEENSEFVKTNITISSNQGTFSTGFSSKINQQLSYVEVNNAGIVLCTAN